MEHEGDEPMSDGNLQADEIGALVHRLGFGGHCIGDKVLYVRRVDPRWSVATRINIEHVLQEAIDNAVKSCTTVLQNEMQSIEHAIRCSAFKEFSDRERRIVRAAVQKERRRVSKKTVKGKKKGGRVHGKR
jgi:hypothetical protein